MQSRLLTPGGWAILGLLGLCLLVLLVRGPSSGLLRAPAFGGSKFMAAGDTHVESIAVGGIAPKIRVTLSSSGSVSVGMGDDERRCEASECAFVLSPPVRDGQISLSIHAHSDTTIEDFHLALIKYSLTTTLARFDRQDWIVVLGLLLAALLFNAMVYRRQELVQWSIVALVVVFLVYNDVLFTLGLLGYLAALYHSRSFVTTARNRHLLFFLLLTSVCFLLLFKYRKEALYEIFANPGGFDLLMPIGVSYFVIRILDTQLRWYRNDSVDVTFREYLFFIIFPGTLIAGPIEDIRSFYANRLDRIGRSDVAMGSSRILIGLFKKIVIADGYLLAVMNGEKLEGSLWGDSGSSVDTLVAMPEMAEGAEIFAFALSGLLFAYIDFSAYSDIAIGLSRLFGFRIRENFNFPVLAPNIREYWKRWHISLSDWSFRNVYFPTLLKSQNSYLPLYLTMLSIGMWHAFNLSWFSWAMHHATGMMIVGLVQKHLPLRAEVLFWLRPLRTALTVTFASLGFVFVYFSDYDTALELYLRYWGWLLSGAGF